MVAQQKIYKVRKSSLNISLFLENWEKFGNKEKDLNNPIKYLFLGDGYQKPYSE